MKLSNIGITLLRRVYIKKQKKYTFLVKYLDKLDADTCHILLNGIRKWVVHRVKILSKKDLLVGSVIFLDDDSENFHVGGLISAVFHVAVNFPCGSSPRRSANDAREHRTIDRSRLAKPTAQPRQGESTTARGCYASGDVISAWRSDSLSSCIYINIMNKGDACKQQSGSSDILVSSESRR